MSSLSLLDLLSMDADEQNILRALTKHGGMTIKQICDRIKQPFSATEAIVERLTSAGQLIETLSGGKRIFSVRLSFSRRQVKNLPTAIVDLLNQDSKAFLQENRLLSGLPSETIRALSDLAEERTLVPEEIFQWQGQPLRRIGLVEMGLLESCHLRDDQAINRHDYLRSGEWIGIKEGLGRGEPMVTYRAVTACTLMTWPVDAFIDIVKNHSPLALALSTELSRQLIDCQVSRTQQQGKIWVMDSLHAGAGSSRIGIELSYQARLEQTGEEVQTLLWSFDQELSRLLSQYAVVGQIADLAQIVRHPLGFDAIVQVAHHQYPQQVELDIILNYLQRHYEYIVCDTGYALDREMSKMIRGKGHILVSFTDHDFPAEEVRQRWAQWDSYSLPGQKRVLAYNRGRLDDGSIDAKFNIVIPDHLGEPQPAEFDRSLVQQNGCDSIFAEAIREVFRRFSLVHTVAIFVPSTTDVDLTVDNSSQVKAALNFLGEIFGGATSSAAEGVWRSDEVGLVAEQVTIVKTFVSKKLLNQHLENVLSFAGNLKSEMNQEAVAISVDNQLILV